MNVKSKFVVILMIGLLSSLTRQVQAQLCNGSLGDPVVWIDFGRGDEFYGPPLGNKTTLVYTKDFVAIQPAGRGYYQMMKNVRVPEDSGRTVSNHTPGDPEGYFMYLIASNVPGFVYQTDVPADLCANKTYEFACWLNKLYRSPNNKPSLTFQVLEMDDRIIATFDAGDISQGDEPIWKQYGFLFTTPPGVTRVKIKIMNNTPGRGNEFGLDDITFRPCGTTINTAINGVANQTEKIACDNAPDIININATVAGSTTLHYQWQKKNGTAWDDLGGEINPQININPVTLPLGVHQYRVMVAGSSEFSLATCRTASNPITIRANASPKITLPPYYPVCVGQNLQMDVSGDVGTYLWSGPNNFSSTLKSPILSNATLNDAGTYQVAVFANGCTTIAQTKVTVNTLPLAAIANPERYICYGTPTMLEASGGTSYKWSPVTDLSDPNIANPIASPTSTTTYEVTVSNGLCENKAQAIVNVYRKTVANAGNNKVIMEGESTTLDGSISGDSLQYLWSPSTNLDDPRKLNPTATPVATTTYTLNVTSLLNCKGATSSMIVKVFKKVIVPNTFTPNDDGVNDVWNIEALQAYPNAEIRVVNRYGEKVFSVKGSFQNWDGRYKGKPLPAGTYFYWIDLHEAGQKPIVGPINILR